MNDKSIIWISAGGVALWLFVAYTPLRDAVIRVIRIGVNHVLTLF
jgi:hypothetical protein